MARGELIDTPDWIRLLAKAVAPRAQRERFRLLSFFGCGHMNQALITGISRRFHIGGSAAQNQQQAQHKRLLEKAPSR